MIKGLSCLLSLILDTINRRAWRSICHDMYIIEHDKSLFTEQTLDLGFDQHLRLEAADGGAIHSHLQNLGVVRLLKDDFIASG